MTSMPLVPRSTRPSMETVGLVNIYQVKSARYFEAQTVTAFGLQRSGRFLWLKPSGRLRGKAEVYPKTFRVGFG